MNDVYEVRIKRWPSKGQIMTTTNIYDTYEEALEYAKVKRKYPCKITIIHRYEVEETVYDKSQNML